MMYRTVTVTPTLTDNIVSVMPILTKRTIEVNAEIFTTVRGGAYEDYEGAYEVTPRAQDEQVLETANKHMLDDVTVFRVPYFETSNEHGTTVYIAEE